MGWLSGWSFRKSHVINPATGAGTNYQVKVTVHYGSGSDSAGDVYLNGKCKTDFGDIRFTDNDGSTLLDYWMKSEVDSDNAVFWVEVADDLSSSNVTIYIYYGNATATTTSNGDNTFLFFDNFNSTLDTSKWVTRQGSISTNAGNLELVPTSGTRGLIDGLVSIPVNSAIYVSVKLGASDTNQHFLTLRAPNDWNNRAVDLFTTLNLGNVVEYQTWSSGVYTNTSNITVTTPTSFHEYEGTWKSGQSTVYQDGSQIVQHTTNIPTSNMVVAFYEGDTGGTAYIDWVFVTKWVSPEPSNGAWGSEETPPAGIGGGSVIPVLMSTIMD